MKMGGVLKTTAYGCTAAILWIDSAFGTAFFVLTALWLINSLLNYKDEQAYLGKMMTYLLSAGGAFYIQNMSSSGIDISKGLVVLLATHELVQLSQKVKDLYSVYQAKQCAVNNQPMPDLTNIDALIDQITASVQAKINQPAITPTTMNPINPGFKVGENGE